MTVPDDWTTGTVCSEGVSLQYYRTGDGPPLVLAHGFSDNGRCWRPLVEDLAADYDVVAYDARAHGRSDAPESGYTIEARVEDLVAVVTELGLEDPILVGHSMGGDTVAWTAALHPELPRALVLEDPAGMLERSDSTPAERAHSVRETVRKWSERGVDELEAAYAETRPDLARTLAVARTECRPEIAEISRAGFPATKDAFGDITAPTLILKADADPETRAGHLAAADELANGRLVHVPDAGHCVFRDQYDAAYAEVLAFLHRV
ncbi:alpha/beta fold hydrolase [Haloferax sp. MBLA0076]|uniref:Alpha/beta fold hydrolase n=1 Tax=Haloferax litoreum TaxID=2666140 RepID=A0A6A8GGP2_9EURY|nr:MULTISPECIES: alpha/beta hydrolase [Haloferax]KAB1193794.1 alpha/beta hydrolase [Haloferax sp. CBA1148]MRX22333.1 alpha/beta fold hydrolase [Haloferax litoreum]